MVLDDLVVISALGFDREVCGEFAVLDQRPISELFSYLVQKFWSFLGGGGDGKQKYKLKIL